MGGSGTTNPSSSNGSGQHKCVRLEPKPDTEMQTGGQEALEEEAAETAEADSDERIALKRKAEGDPRDLEVEDSAMNSLAEL